MILYARDEQINFVRNSLKEHPWKKTKEDFPGGYWEAFYGFIGQIVIGDFLGCERSIEKMDQFDIIWKGKRWDVKTMERTVRCIGTYAHNVNGKQKTNQTEGYIFLSYNKSEELEKGDGCGSFDVRGIIGKEEFMRTAIFFESGTKRKRDDGSLMPVQGEFGMYEIIDNQLKKPQWKKSQKKC